MSSVEHVKGPPSVFDGARVARWGWLCRRQYAERELNQKRLKKSRKKRFLNAEYITR